jgi:hypothetical protein
MKPEAKAPASHGCSVCGHLVPRARLMCPPHWRLVPTAMQVQVYSSFKRFQQAESSTQALARLTEYRQATDAANTVVLAALRGQQQPATPSNPPTPQLDRT